jgi:hypothetical protein
MVYQIILFIAVVIAIRLFMKKQQEAKDRQREKEESFLVPNEGGVL